MKANYFVLAFCSLLFLSLEGEGGEVWGAFRGERGGLYRGKGGGGDFVSCCPSLLSFHSACKQSARDMGGALQTEYAVARSWI